MCWGAAPCSALPTADENAVTESAVTTVSSSLFPVGSYEERVLILLSLAVWNLQATRVSNFLSSDGVIITAVLIGDQTHIFYFDFYPLVSGSLLGAWLGCGPSQSCRGLSAIAASYVPAVVAGLAPGAKF